MLLYLVSAAVDLCSKQNEDGLFWPCDWGHSVPLHAVDSKKHSPPAGVRTEFMDRKLLPWCHRLEVSVDARS